MLYIVQVLYVSFRPTALAGEGLVELLSQPQVCHFLFSTPMSEVQDKNIYKHGTLRKVNCTIMHIYTAKNMLKYIHMQRRLCIACAVTSVNLQCCAGSLTEGSPHWECSNHWQARHPPSGSTSHWQPFDWKTLACLESPFTVHRRLELSQLLVMSNIKTPVA